MNLQEELSQLRSAVEVLRDKDEIRELQYTYGYFIDNRMFREMADLFASEGAWMEIGGRGRYLGKERIHAFLHEVLGGGRWGLARNEVINHVQQQMIISISADRQHAWARSRAQVQGNSPPETPYFLLADGVYENEYVREGGRWKILGITVTMTYYTSLVRERISFPTAPPSETLPPDLPSQAVCPELGRQFNPFHFRHPMTGKVLPTPHS